MPVLRWHLTRTDGRPVRRYPGAVQGSSSLLSRRSRQPQANGNQLVTKHGYRSVNNHSRDAAPWPSARRSSIPAATQWQIRTKHPNVSTMPNCRSFNRRRSRRPNQRSAEAVVADAPAPAVAEEITEAEAPGVAANSEEMNSSIAARVRSVLARRPQFTLRPAPQALCRSRRIRRGGRGDRCHVRHCGNRRMVETDRHYCPRGREQGGATVDRPPFQGNQRSESEPRGRQQVGVQPDSPRSAIVSIARVPISLVRSLRRKPCRRRQRRCQPRVCNRPPPKRHVHRSCWVGRSAKCEAAISMCRAMATSIRWCRVHRCRASAPSNRSSDRTADGSWLRRRASSYRCATVTISSNSRLS